ncbi:glycosyl hydrolase 53 family protein, partial [Ideonella sp.]|uniref:glycosyl hydrolase 53 family protein n=1 Tax=Ideonella sp. TaxID=1929293 RepID=UPI003BB7E402
MDRSLTATAASGDRPAPSAPAPTRWARRLLCGLLAVACGWSQAAAPVPIRGVDVSSLDQIEKAGAVFRSAKGAPADPLRLMKDAGVNWVRLRLWVHPVNREDVVVKGRLLSRKGEPAGGGNNDLQTTLRLAQRAHTLGLKILLDFHYSDFWADPEHQTKPAAWAELSGRELEQAVYKHTRSALQALREAGAYPNMVQIGNEIDHGMLWPDGQIDQPPSRRGESLPATVGGFDGLAALLKAGAKAVRDTDPRQGADGDTRIALHLASGSGLRRFFDAMRDRGVPFDVIGLSYYPQYNTSKQELSGMLSAAV